MTQETDTKETSQEIDRQAAAWIARLDRAPLDQGEQQDLDAWLAAEARHRGALARAKAVFIVGARAKEAGFGAGNFEPGMLPSRRRVLWSAAAAGIAAAVAGVAWRLAPVRYQTARGEMRAVPMADGSVITLNTASAVTVSYRAGRRDVHLLEGEALFDVAPDPTRPFTVFAGPNSVRAVGTSFVVRRFGAGPTHVVVQEGIVDIMHAAPEPGALAAPVRVPANTRAIVAERTADIEKTPLDANALARELAWRQGMLAFQGVSLRQAIDEFKRYSDTPITVSHPDVAAARITGLFSAHNPVGFARTVAVSLDLKVAVTPQGVTLGK